MFSILDIALQLSSCPVIHFWCPLHCFLSSACWSSFCAQTHVGYDLLLCGETAVRVVLRCYDVVGLARSVEELCRSNGHCTVVDGHELCR